jgi:lipid-binding SYLF domain-containing protein
MIYKVRALLWGSMLFALVGCVSQPVVYDEERAKAVADTVAAFRAHEELQPFFEQALGYAVFPANWRAGSGFGGAFGNGWLIENGEVTGRALMLEAFVGPNLGVQSDRKILFFRSQHWLDQFKRGRFEFTGQANLSAGTAGKAVTPGYHPDVAMFVEVRGGLMLEASVGTQRYDFFPLQNGQDQP